MPPWGKGQAGLTVALIKDWGFLSLGFFGYDENPWPAQQPLGHFLITQRDLGDKGS